MITTIIIIIFLRPTGETETKKAYIYGISFYLLNTLRFCTKTINNIHLRKKQKEL